MSRNPKPEPAIRPGNRAPAAAAVPQDLARGVLRCAGLARALRLMLEGAESSLPRETRLLAHKLDRAAGGLVTAMKIDARLLPPAALYRRLSGPVSPLTIRATGDSASNGPIVLRRGRGARERGA
ncbi:MAG: hypothetical protein WDZ66_03995 [Steroidobacteraceae bacterium]